ncbi:MAG TPA: (d)CMP kinase [Syntrophomonadaceae bacterium]|jgi:cytidylate kinase|nr:(d)CMP kinase [Syntrophomonadaceae bacterium]HRX21005.1 (d)CMP kinase [Syntrophomonadaceae bacterium]
MKIAIDGPAGAGKSTLAKALAQKLGFIYIDTGAMYRAVTWKVVKENIDIDLESAVCELAKKTEIHFQINSQTQKIFCDNQDITSEIRSPQIGTLVSKIAAYPSVREIMVKQQQAMAEASNVVMDGRDIGEIVLPDADFKFFLTASEEERIRRRTEEYKQAGYAVTAESIRDDLNRRDRSDSQRPVGALKILRDSIIIDTTNLTTDEALAKMLTVIQGE